MINSKSTSSKKDSDVFTKEELEFFENEKPIAYLEDYVLWQIVPLPFERITQFQVKKKKIRVHLSK